MKAAESPQHFGAEIIVKGSSVLVPKVSSERRRYIPLGFIGPETFCSDLVFLIPDATLYHFGVLHSQFHNAWMRTVAGGSRVTTAIRAVSSTTTSSGRILRPNNAQLSSPAPKAS